MRESQFFDEIIALEELERARKDVLLVLKERFGPNAAKEVKAALDAISDTEELEKLLLLASQCQCKGAFHETFAVALRRKCVVDMLKVRFGPNAANEFKVILDSITDMEKMCLLYRHSNKCCLSDFREALTDG